MKKIVTKANLDYFKDKVIENKENPNKLWHIIKEAAPSNFQTKTTDVRVQGGAGELNKYFVSMCTDSIDEDTREPDSLVETSHRRLNFMELEEATEDKIMQIIKRMPANTVLGCDGISGRALRAAMLALLSQVTRLIHKIISLQKIPSEFKLAVVKQVRLAPERDWVWG